MASPDGRFNFEAIPTVKSMLKLFAEMNAVAQTYYLPSCFYL